MGYGGGTFVKVPPRPLKTFWSWGVCGESNGSGDGALRLLGWAARWDGRVLTVGPFAGGGGLGIMDGGMDFLRGKLGGKVLTYIWGRL